MSNAIQVTRLVAYLNTAEYVLDQVLANLPEGVVRDEAREIYKGILSLRVRVIASNADSLGSTG